MDNTHLIEAGTTTSKNQALSSSFGTRNFSEEQGGNATTPRMIIQNDAPIFGGSFHSVSFEIPPLKLTAKAPKNGPGPKRKGSSSNHQFLGAMSVSGGVPEHHGVGVGT